MPLTRIAIIGSGMAGLAAAYWLNQEDDVRVTLLEKSARLGMDAHRVDAQIAAESVTIDVPSRMFNASQWPNLVALYDQVGVSYDPVEASQSFTFRSISGQSIDDTFLQLDVAFRPDSAIRRMLNSKSRRILSEATRLMKQGRRDLDLGIDRSQTLGQYLATNGYSQAFKTEFLYATLSSTVCTCSYANLDHYPAHIVLETLRRLTDDRALMRTRHGTRDVVTRLTANLDDVRIRYAVDRIDHHGQGVCVSSADGSVETFDHVIVATQANTAISLQGELAAGERELLESIHYRNVDVVVHTDARLMPSQKTDWRTFNMMVGQPVADETIDAAMCTVWLNRFDPSCRSLPDLFQTIGPIVDPRPNQLISRLRLQRPTVNVQSLVALQRLDDIHCQPERRIWYCGSWAAAGVPLLETAVVSAQKIAEQILQPSRRPGILPCS